MGRLLDFCAKIGAAIAVYLRGAGRLAIFAAAAVSHIARPPIYWKEIGRQMVSIGYYSLPVVAMTMLFSGMVLALQSYMGFSRVNAESSVAFVVVLSITRELGPVLAALMVAGRIGASMAAEIGTMAVSEQIDALTTLATNPFKYLITPRIIAGTLMMPLLVLVGDIIGIYGGYLVGIHKLGFAASTYLKNTWDFMQAMDVLSGLVKAAVFGFVISLMGCASGYYCRSGAQGVGRATTNAVVSSSVLVLIANYIITELFFARG
ncbi:ABC transporter permease [Alphaproteobacteria bacterium]|nr:ABC transporter permease [Alphaproteobacteria bacterium]